MTRVLHKKSPIPEVALAAIRILLVAEPPANASWLRSLLVDLPADLVDARTQNEALHEVKRHEFATILLAIPACHRSAFDTVRALRADERARQTPILLLSETALDQRDLEEGYALGATDFLAAPILPIAVSTKVRTFVGLFQDKRRAQRESEQLRLLVQGTIDYAIFMLDVTGRVVSWNAGAERLKGYTADEIIGRHFSCFYPSDMIARDWPAYELEVAKETGRFEDEGWRLRQDGSRFWANVVITALRDEHGDLCGFSKITRDLTERMRAEENARHLLAEQAARKVAEESQARIQASEQQLRMFVEHVPAAAAMLDRELNYVLVSRRWITDYHLENRPIIGRSHYEIFPDLPAAWKEAHRRCLSGSIERSDEDQFIRADGAVTWLRWEVLPWTNAQGEIGGIVIFSEDITERKQAAAALQQQREWLSVTLASIGDAVIATDTHGHVTFLNGVAQTMTGWSEADARGQSLAQVFQIINEQTRKPIANPVDLVLRDGRIVGLGDHTVLIAQDGTERHVDDCAAPIRDHDGNLVGVVMIFRDVTGQRRLERHRNVRLAVTQLLSESTTLQDGAQCVLQAVCERLGWDLGIYWSVTPEGDALECVRAAHRPDESIRAFAEIDLRGKVARGQALPGQVWETGRPAWIMDLSRMSGDRRAVSASADGWRTAFACPIVVADRTLGVLEFYSRSIRQQDPDVLELLITVAGSLGQFIERKSAEDHLRTSEEELADFFENATVGLHWVGPDGTILRANRAELAMLGYRREEFIGHSITEFHADEDIIRDILGRLQAGEPLHDYPARLRCRDGSIKDVLIESSVMFRNGQFVHTRCFTRDVTDRKRAEADLRRAEHRFKAVFNQQFQFTAIVSPQGTVLDANETCFRATGVDRQQVLGKYLWMTPWWDRLPAMQEHWKSAIAEAARTGGPVTGEVEYLISDGTVRHATTVITGLQDDAGQVTMLVVEGHDDTERKNHEMALRESEEKFRLLVDTIPQLAWMARPDGEVFWFNRRWYEFVGTTPDQTHVESWEKLHDPATLPMVMDRWKASLATGEPFDMVFPLRGADRQFRTFLTRINPLKDRDQRVIYWFGTSTDITELKEARAALITSEERLRLALDAGRMGVWDWDIRTGGLTWTESLEPLHGLAPGTFGGTFEDFHQLIHPDDREKVSAAIQRAIDAMSEFDIEFRNIWPNGYVHWIAGKGKVFRGEDGKAARMIGVGMDVTQQKHAEQRSRFLADASAALAVFVDFDSTLQKVANLAVPYFADWAAVDVLESDGSLRRVAVAHVDPAKVELARDLHHRYPPDPDDPNGVWKILRTGRSEMVAEIPYPIRPEDVSHPDLVSILHELGLKSYIGVPLTVREKTIGVITFIVAESGHTYNETDLALAEDLAIRASIAIENLQLYREMREGDRRKDEFLAILAHELRNPLAPIRNGLQVLRLAGMNPQAIADARGMMERQLGHMIRLVDDLLDVSRITRNKLELRRERITLETVITNAIETSRPLIQRAGHRLNVQMPSTPIMIDADPMRLAQVFSNLLNNSAKYTDPGGAIVLNVQRQGGFVTVTVTDTGLGIPADALQGIFEMFSQVDRHLERAQGGLGIGLTLVRRLTEMHGGTVEARSAGLGQGSEFAVRLPVLPELESDSVDLATGTNNPQNVKRRILVVDDNLDSSMSLAMILRMMGNDVRIAEDGPAAISAAESYLPDIVLLDIGLPKLNGYEVCRHIRLQPWSKGMMIVALTGWGQDEDRRRSAAAGFDDHYAKPMDAADLQRLLRKGKS